MIRLASPMALWLLGVVPVLWWLARRSRSPAGRVEFVLRAVCGGLLVVAAAGLQARTGHAPRTTLVLLDRSDSRDARMQARALEDAHAGSVRRLPGDRLGLVAFGRDAVIERPPSDDVLPVGLSSRVDASATDIEAALALARAVLPAAGARRIVLYSDGRETTGDATREAVRLAAAGIPVDVVIDRLTPASGELPRVVSLTAPPDVRIGDPFDVSVQVTGLPGSGALVGLHRDGALVARDEVSVGQTGRAVASFIERRGAEGVVAYTAVVDASGHAGDDHLRQPAGEATAGAGIVVSVSGDSAVLVVSRRPGALTAALRAPGTRLVQVSPERLPASIEALSAYRCVVVDDVAADELTAAQHTLLARFVEQTAGGLLLLGSPRSLDAAGYPASALGRLLPVDLRSRTGKRAPSLAMVVVFDKTGSMADATAGVRHIELARQAVTSVFEVLPGSDRVGVLAFDATATVPVARLGELADVEAITARLRAVEPGGPTALAPALGQALEWLRGPDAGPVRRRLVLLITDGRTSADDAARVRALAGRRDVAVSVVAIGADADRDLLTAIAESTGGRAYFPEDVHQLPRLVAREAAAATAGRLADEPFVPIPRSHVVAGGLDPASLPVLSGYVVSAARAGADVVLASPLDDPVLAAWRVGLGRVAVMTGYGPGSTPTGSEGLAPVWRRAVRWLGRGVDDRTIDVGLRDIDGRLEITVEALDATAAFVDHLEVRADLRGPDGDTHAVALPQLAPGTYGGRFDAAVPGPHVVTVTATDQAATTEHRVLRGIHIAEREQREQGPDLAALRQLAAATGGVVRSVGDDSVGAPRPPAYTDLQPWLVGAALVAFVLSLMAEPLLERGVRVSRWTRRDQPRSAGAA